MAKQQEIFEETIDVYTTPDGWTVVDLGRFEAFLSPECTRKLIEALKISDAMSRSLEPSAADLSPAFGRA